MLHISYIQQKVIDSLRYQMLGSFSNSPFMGYFLLVYQYLRCIEVLLETKIYSLP